MTDALQITRKNYWQVNGNNHATEVEAFEDAANQAVVAPGTTVQVQPPAYVVTYTAPVAVPPAPPTPGGDTPSSPNPPASGAGSDSGTHPGAPSEPSPTTFEYVRGLAQINPVYPAALPPAGDTWHDPTTGATIERVTDNAKLGAADNGGALRNVYSRYTQESCDGKYLLVYGVGSPSSYVIDNAAGVLVRELTDVDGKNIGEPNEIRWSYNEPTVVRYVRDMQFWKQDIATGANTLIRDFAKDFPGASLIMNDVEGDSSHDDQYWCWQAMAIPSSGSYYPLAIFTYNAQTDAILGTLTLANWGLPNGATSGAKLVRPNMVEISPDGKWALVDWSRCWGTGTDPNTSNNGNLAGTHADGPHCYPLTLDTSRAVKVGVDATHGAWAWDASGALGLVSQNNRNDWIEFVDPSKGGYHDDGTGVVRLLNQSALGWNTGYHFAGASGAPGWVLMSTYSSTQVDPGDNQIMLLPITANCNPLRVAPTYGLHDGKAQDGYWQEAAAAWSNDGLRIVWPGNFGGTVKTDVYRITLPFGWQAVAR